MADLNYVSPLTSDLTDYYTKTEVDELQQGDAATFATTAQVDSKDNAVKNWVENKGYLTQHQSLQNYATKNYVDDAIAGVEVPSGVSIEVVNALPSIQNAQENVIYLVLDDSSNTGNIYNEWIYVPAAEDFEMIGNTAEGVIPDLTDYATKQWVEAKGYLDSSDLIGYATVGDLADFTTKDYVDDELVNKADSATLATVATSGDYDDLINKPTIPSLTGYATQTYVNDAVAAIDVPDVSDFATVQDIAGLEAEIANKQDASTLAAVATSGSYNDLTDKPTIPAAPDLSSYATKSELSAKANAADLATVATSGSYNDLSNKPTIPSTSGLASETYVDNAIAAIKGSEIDNDMNWIDEGMARASAIDEINNNVSTAGLSGSYNDLDDKPVIPTVPTNVSSFTNDAGYLTSHQDISGKVDGTIVSGTTTAKIFNEADGGGAQIITASARGFAGVHNGSNPDETYATMYVKNAAGTSTLARVDLDGDGKAYYLKNGASKAAGSEIAVKGDIPDVSSFITSSDLPDLTGYVESSDLATVATSGDYDDLINKPTIPVLPTLATVATSGSYNDLSDKPSIPQNTGITSAAGALPLAFIGFNDSQIYCNISKLSNNQDKVKAFNSGYLCRIAANDNIALLPEEAILPGSDNTSRFRGYTLNNNGTYSVSNGSLSNGQYYIYGKCFVQRISPNAYIQWFDSTANPAVFYKALLLTYSNTTSGLTATTIQGAIDELAAASGGGGISVSDVETELGTSGLQGTDNNGDGISLTTNSVALYDNNNSGITGLQLGGSLSASMLSFNKYKENEYNQVVYLTPDYEDGSLNIHYSDVVNSISSTKTIATTDDIPSTYTAAQLSYDNTNTWNDGTDTDTVQEAIDNLWNDVDGMVNDIDSISQTLADLPAVSYSYNSSTGYMRFTGFDER